MPCLCVHVLLYERCSGQGPEEVPLSPGQLRHVATLGHLLRSLLSCAWCGTRRLTCVTANTFLALSKMLWFGDFLSNVDNFQ